MADKEIEWETRAEPAGNGLFRGVLFHKDKSKLVHPEFSICCEDLHETEQEARAHAAELAGPGAKVDIN